MGRPHERSGSPHFYELGDMARIVEDDGVMVGFLLGFITKSRQGGDVGYVHLVGIHPDHRRRGVGRLLYEAFERDCRKAGVVRMKAITTLGNEGSQIFPSGFGVGHGRGRELRGARTTAHRLQQRVFGIPKRKPEAPPWKPRATPLPPASGITAAQLRDIGLFGALGDEALSSSLPA